MGVNKNVGKRYGRGGYRVGARQVEPAPVPPVPAEDTDVSLFPTEEDDVGGPAVGSKGGLGIPALPPLVAPPVAGDVERQLNELEEQAERDPELMPEPLDEPSAGPALPAGTDGVIRPALEPEVPPAAAVPAAVPPSPSMGVQASAMPTDAELQELASEPDPAGAAGMGITVEQLAAGAEDDVEIRPAGKEVDSDGF